MGQCRETDRVGPKLAALGAVSTPCRGKSGKELPDLGAAQPRGEVGCLSDRSHGLQQREGTTT